MHVLAQVVTIIGPAIISLLAYRMGELTGLDRARRELLEAVKARKEAE